MFKKVAVFTLIAILAVLLSMAVYTYNKPSKHDAKNIDKSLALTLRKDYFKARINRYGPLKLYSLFECQFEDIYVQSYKGNYSGCEIVYMA